MAELPHGWNVSKESLGNERLDLAQWHVDFYWDGGREERYSERELKEKIESEGREGDDPFVKAYGDLIKHSRPGPR